MPLLGAEERIGTVLNGTYRLEALIGQGGMGAVYSASHARLPRRFAVKLLKPEVLGDRDIFERFQREAEIASALGHENIVEVLDFNLAEDSSPYMVLELLEGEALSERIRRKGQLEVDEVARLLDQMASALDAAHDRGIVHRDLKPGNVFLVFRGERDDLVKILDFGISKILHDTSLSTRTGEIMGTPSFMAPEQAMGTGGDIDRRVDIFALGAILYLCLTGRLAFSAPTVPGVVFKVVHAEPTPIREIRPEVPPLVESVIRRAMAKTRDERFATAGALAQAFRSAASEARTLPGEPAPPRPPSEAPAEPSDGPTTLNGASISQALASPSPRLSPLGWMLTLGGLALLAGLAFALGPWATPRVSSAPLVTTPEREAAKPAPVAPIPPAPDPAPAPKVTKVQLTLELRPPTASAELDGVPLRDKSIAVEKSEVPHQLIVRAPGFEAEQRELRILSDLALYIQLSPIRRDKAAPPAPTKRRTLGPLEEDL